MFVLGGGNWAVLWNGGSKDNVYCASQLRHTDCRYSCKNK